MNRFSMAYAWEALSWVALVGHVVVLAVLLAAVLIHGFVSAVDILLELNNFARQ